MPSETRKQMNIGVFVMATGNHFSGWRVPGSLTKAEDFESIAKIAQDAEKAKYDFVFFADAPTCVPNNHPSYVLKFEPTTLLGGLAARTSKIGLVATVSSTVTEAYNCARMFASLDQMSGGRSGWNVVTTANQLAYDNYGRAMPAHDDRYLMATEYLEVVQGLWDSWEEGNIKADHATGEYVDVSKLHVLNHQGKYYKVRGPISSSRSPQGQPVIVQAGSSPAGQQFASQFAEAIFTVQHDMAEAIEFRAGLKALAKSHGRPDNAIKILPGFFPIVGRTEEEAKAKFDELCRYIEPGSATTLMSARYGHDLSKYPLDGPVPELPPSDGEQSFARVLLAKARRENLKLKHIHDIIALSRGYILVMGTGKQVADTMEEWFTSGACDGFMITPANFPSALEDFTELVLPELRARGLFREEYEATTLRGHLGLPVPENRYSKK